MLAAALALLATFAPPTALLAQAADPALAPAPTPPEAAPSLAVPQVPVRTVLPINLPTALQLANVRPLDVALASERVRVALAERDRADVLWLPTLYSGGEYFRHDGQIQDVAGGVFGTSKQGVMLGVGPSAVFAVTDAIFAPLAQRQVVRAREAGLQAARNDSLLAVTEAYFSVQQARGDLAAAEDTVRRAEDLADRADKLAPGLIPRMEAVRVRTELSRRRVQVHGARERWASASADLARVLRLDPAALVEPLEPPHVRVDLVRLDCSVDELIPVALTLRPELASQQALVQATLQRIRQEKLRPLIPSVLLRGFSTPVTGTLAGGYFVAGRNDDLGHGGARMDVDLQVLWEWQNLGFGNLARVNERKAENQVAVLELFRLQDRIAAEVAQAHAQATAAAARLGDAQEEVRDALETVTSNFDGLGQTRRLSGDINLLVVRPQEAVAALQALAQAYTDFYAAVADYDRAQFRLYRALGHPAQLVTTQDTGCPPPSAGTADALAPPSAPVP